MSSSNAAEKSSTALLRDAVYTLSRPAPSGEGTIAFRQEQLGAVMRLRDAPAADHWNGGLLQGLRNIDPEVVSATAQACVERLDGLPVEEAQDYFLGQILDACFVNLSGHPRPRGGPTTAEEGQEVRRVDALERAAAELLRAVTRLLQEHPLSLEHYRSRLLARSRDIKHLEGRGDLAQAVVEFQKSLSDEADRSDNTVAAQLQILRKLGVYEAADSTEATRLAYLKGDSSLPLTAIPRELLQAYRTQLGCPKERFPQAILSTLDNLIRWLDQVPQGSRGREPLLRDLVTRAPSVPWQDRPLLLVRHLEAHLELLPGPDHPEDLFQLLQRSYDSEEGEAILVRGLGLLRRLPLLRHRASELCDFILRDGRLYRKKRAWDGLLKLVESIVTGVADFVLTREPSLADKGRNRFLKAALEHDRKLRALLYRLSTDDALWISRDAGLEAYVREEAWRILLRCLPQDRLRLYEEGLRRGGRFFIATVEEAACQRQRRLWDFLTANWEAVAGSSRPLEERRAALRTVVESFQHTLNYSAVQAGPSSPGLLIKLALDDTDPEVRKWTEKSIDTAGYGLELQRERQKRSLIQLNADLSTSNREIIGLEGKKERLLDEATSVQARRANHALRLQALLQDRNILVCRGWIDASRLQTELAEVQADLEAAIEHAARLSEILRGIQGRVNEAFRSSKDVHARTQDLVNQQRDQENEIRDCQGYQTNAEAELRELTSQLFHADENLAERLAISMNSWRNQIANYNERISRARSMVYELQAEIDSVRECIPAIEERLRVAHADLRTRQADLKEVRNRIEKLANRVRDIKAHFNAQRQQAETNLDRNTRSIQGEQHELSELHDLLQNLSKTLDQVTHKLEDEITNNQRLVQAIVSGREYYERVGDDATQQSAVADTTGATLQEQHQQEVLAEQESRVQYACGLERASRIASPSPTLEQRQRERRSVRQRGETS